LVSIKELYCYCFEDGQIIPNQSTGEQVVITFVLNICRLYHMALH